MQDLYLTQTAKIYPVSTSPLCLLVTQNKGRRALRAIKRPPAELNDNDVKYSLIIALHENNKNVYDLSRRNDLGSEVMTHSMQFQ